MDKLLARFNSDKLSPVRYDKTHLQVYDKCLIQISNSPGSLDLQDAESNYIVFQDNILFDSENFSAKEEPISEYLLKLLVSHYTSYSGIMVRSMRALHETVSPSKSEFFSNTNLTELVWN